MQLKLSTGEAAASGAKRYGVSVSCNRCDEMHDLGISVTIEDGPRVKQSIAAFYDRRPLPKVVSDLSSNSVTCPKTGRQSTQKNNHHIFLIPPNG